MRDNYFDLEHRVTAYLMEIGAQTYLLTELQTGRHFRGHGHAGRLLAQILADADREGATLCLSLDPDGSIGSLDHANLLSFYQRRGFELIEEGALRRLPAGAKAGAHESFMTLKSVAQTLPSL